MIPQQLPEYDYSSLLTYGGTAGVYKIRSPWTSSSQFCVISMTCVATGTAMYSTQDIPNLQNIISVASTGDNPYGVRGIPFAGTANTTTSIGPEQWTPIYNQGQLTVISGTIFITVAFRRLAEVRHSFPNQLTTHDPQHESTVLDEHATQLADRIANGR